MTLWGGRFSKRMEPGAWEFNASLAFDRRLAHQDVRASIAWAGTLVDAGMLNPQEGEAILGGLVRIQAELANGVFEYDAGDEDIHSAVERRLGELIGQVSGKLHTGRSRNDQVATDFRLWLLDQIPALDEVVSGLQTTLLTRAQMDLEIPIPGYTHLQRAQPVLLSHWWLSHFWPLQRDRERLRDLRRRTSVMPLGSGALAGCPFPIDRAALAGELGFLRPSINSIDAVSDRDFVLEFLFWAALLGIHISRLSAAIILFCSVEFGFFEVADAYATGSSLMPQKKNPDLFELARGKTGTLIGQLTGTLTMLKGLPSAYDKDMQEDKQPVFTAVDTVMAVLPVISAAVGSLSIDEHALRTSIDATMLTTDLADYLVEKNVPFREAHHRVGEIVQLALEKGIPLDRLEIDAFRNIHPAFSEDVFQVFDLNRSLARRVAIGGTAPQAVRDQLETARQAIQSLEPLPGRD